jgi:hypothetical protein
MAEPKQPYGARLGFFAQTVSLVEINSKVPTNGKA